MTAETLRLAGIVLLVGGAGAALVWYSAQIAEAFKRDFGGGPRPPSHPLPGDDRVIVLRRAQRKPAAVSD
jgi:hypothetical protein